MINALLAGHLEVIVAAKADVMVLLRARTAPQGRVSGLREKRGAGMCLAGPRALALLTFKCLMYRITPHLSQRVQRPLLRSTGLLALSPAVTGSEAAATDGFTEIGPLTYCSAWQTSRLAGAALGTGAQETCVSRVGERAPCQTQGARCTASLIRMGMQLLLFNAERLSCAAECRSADEPKKRIEGIQRSQSDKCC